MVAIGTLAARPAAGDELRLKNGDVLHGEALSADGTHLKFKHAHGSEVTVPWADVASVETDKPVKVKLLDGQVLMGKLRPGTRPGAGTLVSDSTSPVGFDLGRVATLNEKEDAIWTGRLAAGMTISDGNTRSKTFFGSFDGERLTKFDRIEAHAFYNYASTKDQVTGEDELSARKGYARIQYSYYFWQPLYIYAGGALEYDYFQNLRLRSRGGGGLGWAIAETKTLLLRLEAGIEYVNEDYRRVTEDRDFTALRGAFQGEWQATEWLRLGEVFEIFPNTKRFRDFFLRSTSSASVAVWGNFGFAGIIIWEHDQIPSDESRNKNDTQYILTLTYTF